MRNTTKKEALIAKLATQSSERPTLSIVVASLLASDFFSAGVNLKVGSFSITSMKYKRSVITWKQTVAISNVTAPSTTKKSSQRTFRRR